MRLAPHPPPGLASVLLLTAVLAACGSDEPGEGQRGTDPGVDPAEAPAPVAATPPGSAEGVLGLLGTRPDEHLAVQGELPCADCAGIRTTLILDAGGTFQMDEAYLGLSPERVAQGDTLFGTRGRWTVTQDRARIRLDGFDDGPRYFRPTSPEILLLLDRQGEEIESELNYESARLPRIPELAGALQVRAAFTYMADAPGVVLCASGFRYPVAMEAGYLELERRYLAEGVPPGAPLRVHLTGSVEARPAMEGEATGATFVVRTFEVADPGTPCPALEVADALAEGEWRLTSLDGAPVPTLPDPGETPTLSWDPQESQLHGTGGCNRYSGRGFLRGSELVTGGLAGTRRYCEGVMEVEDRVLEILTAGGSLRFEEGVLRLFQGPVEVARFRR